MGERVLPPFLNRAIRTAARRRLSATGTYGGHWVLHLSNISSLLQSGVDVEGDEVEGDEVEGDEVEQLGVLHLGEQQLGAPFEQVPRQGALRFDQAVDPLLDRRVPPAVEVDDVGESDGDYLNLAASLWVCDGEEKPMKAALTVPGRRPLSHCECPGVVPDGRTRHYRLMRRRRTVAHGISFTLPVSRSLSRRAISASQAASAPSSIWLSRLSRSDPATAARASGGRASASFRISAASRFIVRFYTTCSPPASHAP